MNAPTDAMVLEGIKVLEFFGEIGRLKMHPQDSQEDALAGKRELVESIYAQMADKA